eukprot:2589783-Alexandrium_andersonii.AAC.1
MPTKHSAHYSKHATLARLSQQTRRAGYHNKRLKSGYQARLSLEARLPHANNTPEGRAAPNSMS